MPKLGEAEGEQTLLGRALRSALIIRWKFPKPPLNGCIWSITISSVKKKDIPILGCLYALPPPKQAVGKAGQLAGDEIPALFQDRRCC